MSNHIQLVKPFAPHIKSRKDLDGTHLSNSVRGDELERRMRVLDQRNDGPSLGLQ
jgi:hypothetical protein